MGKQLNDQTVAPAIPHSEFGDPGCFGGLWFVLREDQVEIVCDRCQKVIQMVSGSELKQRIERLLSVRAVSSIGISSVVIANWAASMAAQFGAS
jgi:hypothetical protein